MEFFCLLILVPKAKNILSWLFMCIKQENWSIQIYPIRVITVKLNIGRIFFDISCHKGLSKNNLFCIKTNSNTRSCFAMCPIYVPQMMLTIDKYLWQVEVISDCKHFPLPIQFCPGKNVLDLKSLWCVGNWPHMKAAKSK